MTGDPVATRPTLLVIDDDKDLIRGLSIRLGAQGFDVAGASDSMRAVTAASGLRPDVIILDLRMPHRSGFEILEDLRNESETSHIPVLVLSANVAELARSMAINLGATAYMTKPFSAAALVRTIVSLVRTPLTQPHAVLQ